ncbi:Pre-mRNA-splicing ATP-dependent RNA helicase prp28 [Salinomyces thailandicus]|uniref:RNA helicase n=1 Tax=Salinomyces thailandicus TaxID=706561 RepID=A0A4U0TZ08_9PEZI|nr:Pre-mRNA-splicing ATP-dependent RNA helicase prp28 [Salinomyces thailandica]
MDDIPPPPPPPPSDELVPPPPPTSDIPPPPPSDDLPASASQPGPVAKKRKLGWGSAPKAQPLSIEELLAKKKAADAAAAKPKFLSKKERERLALEKRQKEVAQQSNGHAAAASSARHESESPAPVANGARSREPPTGPRAARYNGDGHVPTGPASMRQQQSSLPNKGYDMAPPPPPKPIAVTNGPQTSRKNSDAGNETEMIRQRYMGADTNTSTFSAKKKRKRTTEKKFNFAWNTEEDTTASNPLYAEKTDVNFFGRGRLGGFADDANDTHAKSYAKAIAERDPEAGRQRAQEILEMQRRMREEGGRNGIDRHWSDKELHQMRERDWRIFKEDFNIATKGGSIPNPMRSWKESGLPSGILQIVDNAGYTEPSAVQRAAIPIALQNRDLIGVAVTGSGKTAAFLLPLLVYISALPTLDEMTKNDGPYAIILAPTRELAQQIELEARKFATPLGFKCVSLVGGHSIEEQSYNMRDGAEIIIATPGRLVDCIERRVLVLSQCCYIIMDEADRMIDLGFEEPVNKILDALPVSNEKPDTDAAEDGKAMGRGGYRQTMMYTATMPAAVERIARKYLRRPAIVTIGNVGEAVDTVEQRVEFVGGEDKRKRRLNEILHSREFAPPIIVFVNIKRNCDAIARDISKMGFKSVTLHGSKTQDQREAALASLRDGTSDVLVATDLAGRGIDVPDVSLVVNFNMATNIESYTHRVGRTGRAGKQGVAVTFLGSEDHDVLYDLKQMISKSSLSRVPEELRRHEAAQQKQQKGGRGARAIEESGGFGGKGGWG